MRESKEKDRWDEFVLLGLMPKEGGKKIWRFFFLPQDGAIGMNSTMKQEALVSSFSMFISLIQ